MFHYTGNKYKYKIIIKPHKTIFKKIKLYLKKNYDIIFQLYELVLYSSLLGNGVQTPSS